MGQTNWPPSRTSSVEHQPAYRRRALLVAKCPKLPREQNTLAANCDLLWTILNLLPLRVRNGRQNPFRNLLDGFLFFASSSCSGVAQWAIVGLHSSRCWHLLHHRNAAEHNLRVILSVKWFKLTFFSSYVRATVILLACCCCCCPAQSDQ